MDDFDRFGSYYNRAERHITIEFIVDIVIAIGVSVFGGNLFYGLVCLFFATSKIRQLNIKNRQLEILNRLDQLEENIKQ
jgi:hypothetical protein